MGKRVGFIGLGKMGQNMVLNLLKKDYEVAVFNRTIKPIKEMQEKGAIPSYSLQELASKLQKPRIIILMITAGKAIDEIISRLMRLLDKGDVIIDGGNSFYKDSIKRYKLLKTKGIDFIDMGTSGGLNGARYGASLTIGGNEKIFKKIEQLFRDISTKNGYAYAGKVGAGHFVKMIHNGIEYALLESYGEGFEMLEKSPYKLSLKNIAKVWNNGSIIRSHITELIESILTRNPKLKNTDGIIGGGETGSWAYNFAKSRNIEAESVKHALKKRKLSEKKQSFSTRLISLIRKEFGGHKTKRE